MKKVYISEVVKLFELDPKSGIPVYIQLKEGLKLLILQGIYPPGERLPTVRQMAIELRINSNTVARSYSELERDGIISTQQGRGTFVCSLPDSTDHEAKEIEFNKLLDTFLKDTLSLGFDKQYILERMQQKFSDNK